MSHLSTERLAALADEPGTAAELAHLATCEECARERRAYVVLLATAASERARIGEPLSSWEGIARELAAGETHSAHRSPLSAVRRRTPPLGRAASRLAAAVVLVAGGVVAGRYSAGAPLVPNEAVESGTDVGGERTAEQRTASSEEPALAASVPTVADSAAPFASLEEARVARARYEALYQNAAAYIARHDTAAVAPESPAAMRTRLAALDRVDRAMREAMHEAPYDPVINGYYLTTIGQREQTLRQLNTVLPIGMRINSF